MTRRTMRSPRLERRLDRDGYLVLRGLAKDDLAFIREIYRGAPLGAEPTAALAADGGSDWNSRMAPGDTWRISTDECGPDQRARVHRAMEPVWRRLADAVLDDHHIVINSFLTKHPGPDSVLPLHQDPNVVDEHKFRSVTAWIAIDDITVARRNGALHVLAGSHRVGLELRGTNTEPSYIGDLERLWPYAVPLDARAGDVIFLDSRLLHGSPPNRSDEARGAVAGMMVPREAPLCHAVGVGRDGEMVEVLRVDPDFFLKNGPRSLRESVPSGYPVVATVPRVETPTSGDPLIAQQRHRRSVRGRVRRLFPRR